MPPKKLIENKVDLERPKEGQENAKLTFFWCRKKAYRKQGTPKKVKLTLDGAVKKARRMAELPIAPKVPMMIM